MGWQQLFEDDRKPIPVPNAWVKPEGLEVYVRRGQKLIEGKVQPTLEIANVRANQIGTGALTRWVPEFESLADKLGRIVFVENVLNPRFREFWSRRGYVLRPHLHDFCYWRPPAR